MVVYWWIGAFFLLMVTASAMDAAGGGGGVNFTRVPKFSGKRGNDFSLWLYQFMAVATFYGFQAAITARANGDYGEDNLPASQAAHDALSLIHI